MAKHPLSSFPVASYLVGKNQPLTVFCGPCVIESEEHAFACASELKKIFDNFPVNFIFKSSFDKANRSSVDSFRGPGIEEGMKILAKIKKELNIPVVTDIHLPEQANIVASVVDVIQIPAFLCRQTDLLLAAGRTHLPLQIKKGQFLSPRDMRHVVAKVLSTGNDKIFLTDRGTFFGYNNLITDMRSIKIMQELGCPVCFDATHSVQLPGALAKETGGEKQFVSLLSRAAIAAGANALFIEAHPCPEKAPCDGSTSLAFESLKRLLKEVCALYKLTQSFHEET